MTGLAEEVTTGAAAGAEEAGADVTAVADVTDVGAADTADVGEDAGAEVGATVPVAPLAAGAEEAGGAGAAGAVVLPAAASTMWKSCPLDL